MEFDLDKALEEVPIHVEDPPLPPPPPPAAASPSLDRMSVYGDLPPPPTPLDAKSCLGELLPVEHVTLEHRTKFRPKPKKRTKPSRPSVGRSLLSKTVTLLTTVNLGIANRKCD